MVALPMVKVPLYSGWSAPEITTMSPLRMFCPFNKTVAVELPTQPPLEAPSPVVPLV